MPARGQGPGFGLTITDDAGNDQLWIVVGGTVRVRDSVSELSAFVYGPWRFWSYVARNATRERELREEALHTRLVLGDVWVNLAIGTFEVGVSDEARPAMSGAGYIDHVKVVLLDKPVQVNVNKVQAWSRSPV